MKIVSTSGFRCLPERLESWNYAYREGLDEMLCPEFASLLNTGGPFEHMETLYAAIDAEDTTDRLLAYDWRLTLADNDLRKVSTAGWLDSDLARDTSETCFVMPSAARSCQAQFPASV